MIFFPLLFCPHPTDDKRTCSRAHSLKKKMGSKANKMTRISFALRPDTQKIVLRVFEFCGEQKKKIALLRQSNGKKSHRRHGLRNNKQLWTKLRFLHSDVAKIARHVLFAQRPPNNLIFFLRLRIVVRCLFPVSVFCPSPRMRNVPLLVVECFCNFNAVNAKIKKKHVFEFIRFRSSLLIFFHTFFVASE